MKKYKLIVCVFMGLLILTNELCFALPIKKQTPQPQSEELKEVKSRLYAIYNTNNLKDAYRIVSSLPENERDSEIWFILANITQDLNEEEDSIFYLQKAILTDKTNDKAYYNLGNLYFNKGQTFQSIKMYKEAIKLKKDFAPYHFNLGCAYFKAEDYKSAKNEFAHAAALQPNMADYRYNLALTYKKLGNDKKAQAELDNYNKLKQE